MTSATFEDRVVHPVLLPEQWRVRLMTASAERTEWFSQFSATGLTLLDWNSPLTGRVIVAGVDPSTAEFLLKAPLTTRCVIVDTHLSRWTPVPGVRRLERAALARPDLVVVPAGCSVAEMWANPARYFERAIGEL